LWQADNPEVPMTNEAQVFQPAQHAVYRADKMGKATLFQSPRILVGLNAFEPGQSHAVHAHAGMDKVYHVLEGSGLLLLEDREVPLEAGMLATAPADVPHGLRNTGDGRLLVLAILAPAPGAPSIGTDSAPSRTPR